MNDKLLESRVAKLERLMLTNKRAELERRITKLEKIVRHKTLEGGASGHMAHIYDYTDLTLAEVKDIITNLFSGKVEDVTEKLDGMNMQCTVNNDGNVVFIRNKKDLNSPTGGMSLDDVIAKWAGKEHVSKIYTDACNTITKVFKKIGKEFFNPNKDTKILANCECIGSGKTNIILYSNAQVDFHNLWVYTRDPETGEWKKSDVTTKGLDTLEKACDGIDGAQLTPKVIIRVTEKSDELADKFNQKIEEVFKDAGCSTSDTIEDYKKSRFYDLCSKKHKWILQNKQGAEALYNRWFNDDKSFSLKEIKKIYKDNLDDLANVDYKQIVAECMRPLDTFFGNLGNAIIRLCDGLVNAGDESATIEALRDDLADITDKVRKEGSVELNDKLTNQLNRLAELGDQINASEGIVFKYGDRLMKSTGSFAAVNQILGIRYSM